MGHRRRLLDHVGGCRRAVRSAAVERAEVRVLGPVDVAGPDGVVGLPSASQRRLLAALAVHAPQPVRSEWLAWVLGISPGALRKIVARVRSAVGADLIVTTATGYRLDAPVDALLAVGELERAGGDPDLLRCALDRWRGPALDEFRDEAWANGETTRLDEVRATAVEDLAEALLQRGRWSEAISTLAPHIHDNEFRDRPRGLLMRAQAAAGRRTEALRSFRTYRSFLGEQAGLEPSADLRRVEQRIATGWNGLDPHEPDESDSGRPSGRRQVPAIPARLVTTKPIVGRRRELEALVGVVAEAEGAGSRTVLVSGESGIGKTSLLAAVASICSARSGWSVFYGRCTEVGSEPFQPFGALLGHVVDALAEDEIAAHAARCGGDLARIVPQLRSRVPEPTSAVVDDPATARHLLFHAAATSFDELPRRVRLPSSSTICTGPSRPASSCCASWLPMSPACRCSSSAPSATPGTRVASTFARPWRTSRDRARSTFRFAAWTPTSSSIWCGRASKTPPDTTSATSWSCSRRRRPGTRCSPSTCCASGRSHTGWVWTTSP
jgi:DNA-binding SARP family transcriptional activator